MSALRNFGVTGDGKTDDTKALRHAVENAAGAIEFGRGTYRISETIEIDLLKHGPLRIDGQGGLARIVMAGPGPAFRLTGHHEGTAVPRSVKEQVWRSERAPSVTALEIVGEHPEADGIVLVGTMQATIEQVLIHKVRNGVTLADRNRNFLLRGCHIYDNSGVGVFFDRCNLHQVILSANHISYNRQCGIKSLGGDLHNLQIVGNDIEYNYDLEQTGAADLWFDVLEDGTASEVTIAGNTIQAVPSPGGTNLRITGRPATAAIACLFAVTGNILGSQTTNVELQHADRITLSGNTIYDGKAINILAADSQNVAIGTNTFGWRSSVDREMIGGIRLERCTTVNLHGLTLDDIRLGDEKAGAAVTLIDCADSIISSCQILDPRWRGLSLANCRRVSVSNNIILDRRDVPTMLSAIEVSGESRENVIQGNLLQAGRGEALRSAAGQAATLGNTILE